MNFELSDEQRQIRETLTDFAEREIKPHSSAWDKDETFPRESSNSSASWVFSASRFPKNTAAGAPTRSRRCWWSRALALRRRRRPLVRGAHVAVVRPYRGCSRRTRNELITAGHARREKNRRVVPDRARLGFRCGRDATRAVRSGDNSRINGAKMFITNGGVADVYVVMAVTDAGAGRSGVSAFIVDRGTPGLSNGRKIEKLGLHSSDTAEVVFDNVTVPARNLIGEVGAGYQQDAQGARRRAHRDRRVRGRHRARRDGRCGGLREGAPPVRQGDRRLPGDPDG